MKLTKTKNPSTVENGFDFFNSTRLLRIPSTYVLFYHKIRYKTNERANLAKVYK